ncbi:outer membrane protein insertion porin family [Mariprofundus micogutta]|uniref:Outer membrane protein assembly factor BamA n=1 Tax=Mariprofundus micogutta TaxID=1921010 RepID=A0A1L8CJW8_9PROT|nr:outer membrane protein assembly factor BamA [Mariprofundus micogutta]GAV19196.1 outer membrane protein insertion porin family [Mariprofundus micogutta]
MLGSLKYWIIAFGLLLSGLLSFNTVSAAEDNQQTASRIISIDVQGNRFVEKETILDKMTIKVGDSLDRRKISKNIRRLHRTGFFSDVRFTGTRTAQGIHFVCHVKEFPLIASLKMQGNDEHTTKDLQLRMKLKPGRVFSPKNKTADRNTLLKGYLKDGFYQVAIHFITTPRDDGRVDLVVKIDEGNVTRISRVRFIGNKAISSGVLREEIASRQSDLPSWISDRDVFDQKRFAADSQMLQQYYMDQGYLDMKIESMHLAMSSDKKSFDLSFSVFEGPQYTVSKIDVQGDLVPDKETLKELISMKEGRTYSLTAMSESIAAITGRVGDEGYAFASVTPLMKRNIEDRTVSISFEVEKGEEAYVERIEVVGNEKTDDSVVRRELKQAEGARYSGTQVEQSKKNLSRSAFVEDVRVSLDKASSGDKVNMNVNLTERKTGSITGGIGYSQIEKVTFHAKIQENNLFGKGYQASLNGEYGAVTQNITTSLTDPYFLGLNMSATVNGFKTKTDPQTTTTYQMETIGGGFGFGIPITPELSYGISYQYKRSDLSLTNTTISPITLSQLGRQTTGEVTQNLTWDSRDRLLGTTEGQMHQLHVGAAGLGGSDKFYEVKLTNKAYFPIDEKHRFVLNPIFEAGYISGYSNLDVPLYRRYSLGGSGSVRGFDSLGISLRDPNTGEAVGGDKKFNASLNLFFPLPFVKQSGIRGVAFVDAGTVWGSVSATVTGLAPINITEAFSLSRLRSSAGLGIEWMSPVGPIGLLWAIPIRTVSGDVQRNLEFMMGGSF